MKESERSEFDNQWKRALEGAEGSPASSVWSNIDRELALAEGKESQRRLVFYQRLAAACAMFALMAGAFGVYHWQEGKRIASLHTTPEVNQRGNILTTQPNPSLALDNANQENVTQQGTKELNTNDNLKPEYPNNKIALTKNGIVNSKREVANSKREAGGWKAETENSQNELAEAKSETDNSKNGLGEMKSGIAVVPKKGNIRTSNEELQGLTKTNQYGPENLENQLMASNDGQKQIAKNQNPGLNAVQNKNIELYLAENDPELTLLPTNSIQGGPVDKEIVRKLPAISSAFMAQNKRKDIKHEKLWASVVASAGTYTDNGGSPYTLSSSSTAVPSGNSYSMGMLGGARIAKRWVLQSGVQYMNQTANYFSDVPSSGSLATVADAVIHPAAHQASSGPRAFAAPVNVGYGINSSNQFVSVPVQAGYLLVDKKIGWQINSGVATDIFMRNTLSDPSGKQQSYSQGAGGDSPYRQVNFSGLMSSEVSYKLGKNYRIGVVPGFKYAFSPMLKTQTSGNPFVWDVGFRFRYIFK